MQHRGNLNGVLAAVFANAEQLTVPADVQAQLRSSISAVSSNQEGWLAAIGATEYLARIREHQIRDIEHSLSKLFGEFPLFASLSAETVSAGAYADDAALGQASTTAARQVLSNIDKAIIAIAQGRIEPFDLPRAVAATRERLPAQLRPMLARLTDEHRVIKFAKVLGLTFLETAVAMIPVVGPVLAGGVFAGQTLMSADELHQRSIQARADTDPFVGVLAPKADLQKEALVLAAGVIARFGIPMVVGRMSAQSTPKVPHEPPVPAPRMPAPRTAMSAEELVAARQPTSEHLARIGEPARVLTEGKLPGSAGYRNPPDMVSLRGRPLDLSKLDPNEVYLWVVDSEGNFLYARQKTPGFDPHPNPRHRDAGGREVKHGDLTPGPGGERRGEARLGGELKVEKVNGKLTGRWRLDSNSSYNYVRRLPAIKGTEENLKTIVDLLAHYGTDVSKIFIKHFD